MQCSEGRNGNPAGNTPTNQSYFTANRGANGESMLNKLNRVKHTNSTGEKNLRELVSFTEQGRYTKSTGRTN